MSGFGERREQSRSSRGRLYGGWGGGCRVWEVLIDGGCGERPLGGQVLSRGSAGQIMKVRSTALSGQGMG